MFAKVASASYLGVEGYPVSVEVDISPGLPAFDLVGLANTAVREARERVRSALKNSPFPYPKERITINLAPADIPKQGSALDLPIAVGILAAQSLFSMETLQQYSFIGELSLDGDIRPVRGALAVTLTVRDLGLAGLVLPAANYAEVKGIQGIQLIPVANLEELANFLQTGAINYPSDNLPAKPVTPRPTSGIDLANISGQAFAKRGLEIAAAGGHNMLLIGPPGSGKTLISRAIPTILPPLGDNESLEVTRIHSIAGIINELDGLFRQRPFRQPHHSITPAGLVGGGTIPTPGEISLAHHGVLFLDEMAEFKPDLLDLLRQPLESGQMVIARNRHRLVFPARFILIGATNPCKCGFFGDPSDQCQCTPSAVKRYFRHISGPLLDRMDLHVQVSRLTSSDLFTNEMSEPSSRVLTRVIAARAMQAQRAKNLQRTDYSLNSQIPPALIQVLCQLAEPTKKILMRAMDSLNLTARGCHQILKIARTIADLRQAELIEPPDLAEAIQYRSCERLYS